LLKQDGVHLPGPEPPAGGAAWTAADAMLPAPALVDASTTVQGVLGRPELASWPAVLVGSGHELLGVVSSAQLAQAVVAGRAAEPISVLVADNPVHAHPDHPPDVVIERVAESGGVLPVVDREHARHVVGVVTLDGLARFIARRGP
jgi:CBS domain-containing protein